MRLTDNPLSQMSLVFRSCGFALIGSLGTQTQWASAASPSSSDSLPPETFTFLTLPHKLLWNWALVLGILVLTLVLVSRRFGHSRQSFQRTSSKWNFLLTICLVLIVLGFNAFTQVREYRDNYAHIQEKLMDKVRSQLRQRTLFILDFIESEKQAADSRLHHLLKQQVDTAYQNAQSILKNSGGKLNRAELTRLVMETLRPMRHSNGRGYMFATRMDGTELLFADHPEFEGRNMLDLKDSDGVYYVREMIRLCREKGEGYVAYRISKPGSTRWDNPKLAYVRYLKPLDCFIGTGDYLEDYTVELQQEVADHLHAIQFSGELTIFGGELNGLIHFGPGRGKTMIDVTDHNGKKVVQELIQVAREGGGFVQYHMPETVDHQQYPKLSYAALVPGWNWYVGAGINLDHVEEEKAYARQALEKIIVGQMLESAALIPLAALIFLLLGHRLAKRIDGSIATLKNALDHAAHKDILIDATGIEFEEFAHIAEAANSMLVERQQASRALMDREENLSVTLDSIGDAVIATDAQGRVTRMNPVAQKLTGWVVEEARGKELLEVFPIFNAKTGVQAENPVDKVLATGQIVGLANHTVLRARNGKEYQIADSAAPIRGAEGTIHGVILVFRDVTEEYALHQALKESEEGFRAMFDNAPLLIALADAEGRILFINELWCATLGYNNTELMGRSLGTLITAAEKKSFETLFQAIAKERKPAGRIDTLCDTSQHEQEVALDLSMAPISGEDGHVKQVLLMAKDVTERRGQELRLEWLVMHDTLTGLANRASLLKFLENLLRAPMGEKVYWLFLFDLDQFKGINDNYGHLTGDGMLRETGQRLSRYCPAEGLAARLSGDEFVIVTPCASLQEVEVFAGQLRALIREPITCNGLRLQIETSIGAVAVEKGGVSEILRRADLAMYEVKRNRLETGIQLYNEELDKAIRDQQRLEEDLKIALDAPDQFILHYQPIWSLKDGSLKGAEALVRWQHPTRGLLPPGKFIPLAEKRAHIVRLGKIVLQHACRDIAVWSRDLEVFNDTLFRVTVNMAPQQLMTADLVESVAEDLAFFKVKANRLCLEITETALMKDPSLAARRINALQTMGINIAIDDFGTGYSSLSYLNQFHVNTIKLDRSLISGIEERGASAKVSDAVIRLAHDLDLDVVAEGVETPSQLKAINDLGCDFVQGFLTGKPMPAQDLTDHIRTNCCALLVSANSAKND